MNSLPWLRLYCEAVDDEKLRLLSFEDRWHYVAILCCKGLGILEGEDAELRRRKVAVKLGLDEPTLAEVARRLAAVGLIERETFTPLAWDRRQFRSDHDPTRVDRIRKFREKKRLEREAHPDPDGNGRVTRYETEKKRTRNGRVTEPETETETDTEVRSRSNDLLSSPPAAGDDPPDPGAPKFPRCPFDAIVRAYHETLPSLPRVGVLSEARKKKLALRWRDVCVTDQIAESAAGVDVFRAVFSRAASSDFLTGRAKDWKASLDWLIEPRNFIRVAEGHYDNRTRR